MGIDDDEPIREFEIPEGWPDPDSDDMTLDEYLSQIWEIYGTGGSASEDEKQEWWDSHREDWEGLSPEGMASTG